MSTSWNSETAYPDDGYYQLNLGSSACDERVTVYVNGYTLEEEVHIPNSGNAIVDFVLKGTSDVPIR